MIVNSKPIFHEPWWLNVTAGENNWGECLVTRQNETIARMPWFKKNKFGLTVLTNPPLTPFLGPWFGEYKNKNGLIKSFQDKKIANELIDQLPRFNIYRSNFTPEVSNWLPWYWKNYSQTTRYTYRFNSLNNLDQLWLNLRGNIRSDIKKARNKNISVIFDGDLEDLLVLHKMTWSRQGLPTFVKSEVIHNLDKECSKAQKEIVEQ